MDNTIDIKNNKFTYKNRDIYIIFDGDRKPWFHANSIAEISGYIRPGKAVNDHVDEKYKITYSELKKFDTTKSHTKIKSTLVYIDDPGVCCLLAASKIVENEFRDWVFAELLPNLRKHQYGVTCLETENRIFKTLIKNSQIQQMFGLLRSKNNETEYKFIDTQKRFFNKVVEELSKEYVLCFDIEYINTDDVNIIQNVLNAINKEGVDYEYIRKSKSITIYDDDLDLINLVKKSCSEVMSW